jgi:ligand-binding SRPBCC domain-containing protein
MRPSLYESEIVVPRPRPEVFAFFSDAANLQELTPTFLHFRLETPTPIAMAEGALIDYRLRVHRVPVRWRTRIAAWEPPRRFVDEQLRGPYRLWVHEHLFEEAESPPGTATRVIDRVRYAVPGGPLGTLADRLLVRRDVERIFAFRRQRLAERFGARGSDRRGQR